MPETAEQWSLRTWKARHAAGYFPRSEQHAGWRVYDTPPEWLMDLGKPMRDDVVLEVGCGYGEWMIPLAPHVREVSGIDIHEEPIRKAGELFEQRGIRNAQVSVTDGRGLPFPSESFSLVYSISVFQHLPRSIVQGYLHETTRVLRPGGRCLHHFRNADNIGPYPPLADDIVANHTGDFSVGWTAAEVERAGEEAGLAVEIHDIGLFLVMAGAR